MTGSGIIDLIIAMALFYFALSAVCSGLNDLLERIFEWRASNFQDAIISLFNGTRGQPNAFVTAFYDHPLIQTLVRESKLATPGYMRRLQTWARNVTIRLGNAVRGVIGTPSAALVDPQAPQAEDKLSTVPANLFVQTVFDLIKTPDWKGSHPLSIDDFNYLVGKIADPGLKKTLQSITEAGDGTIDGVRKAIADWYESTMQRASDWYRRHMRAVSVVVASIFCFAFNVDSVEVANRFYSDAGLRAAFVAQAAEEAKIPPEKQRNPNEMAKEVFKLNIGWNDMSGSLEERWEKLRPQLTWLKIMGLLITAVAISMGAPFWHDLFSNLLKRREAVALK